MSERQLESNQSEDRKPRRPAPSSPASVPDHPLLNLQQQAGNQTVQSALRASGIRAKLAIGGVDDAEEREADSTAQGVVEGMEGKGIEGSGSSEVRKGESSVIRRKAAPLPR